MNERQFADRIGNIDDRLVEEARYRRYRRGGGLRRFLTAAVVAALMAASFTVGALAFSREVPVEQETVELSGTDLTLIMPDQWKDRYTLEKNGESTYSCYSNLIREKGQQEGNDLGMLFYITLWPEQLTEEQVNNGGEWNYAACRYIMTTKEGTYLLYNASDVQWDPSDPEQEEEYLRMSGEVSQIRFVVDNVLTD